MAAKRLVLVRGGYCLLSWSSPMTACVQPGVLGGPDKGPVEVYGIENPKVSYAFGQLWGYRRYGGVACKDAPQNNSVVTSAL